VGCHVVVLLFSNLSAGILSLLNRVKSMSPPRKSATLGGCQNNKIEHLAFATRNPTRALAACLQCPNHLEITTDKLVRFHSNKFNETPYKLDPLRIRIRSRNTQTHLKFLCKSLRFLILTLFFLNPYSDFVSKTRLGKCTWTYY